MTPVAQEHASFATIGLGSSYEPIDEITTVLIVNQAVALETKVYIGADCYFTE